MNVLPLLQLLGMNGTDSLPPLGQHWIDQLPFAHRLASMQDQSYMEGNFNKPDERTRQLHPSLTGTMALVKGGLAWVEGHSAPSGRRFDGLLEKSLDFLLDLDPYYCPILLDI